MGINRQENISVNLSYSSIKNKTDYLNQEGKKMGYEAQSWLHSILFPKFQWQQTIIFMSIFP